LYFVHTPVCGYWVLVRVYFTFGKSPVEVHCADVSTCIVGVRDGCRLQAQRLIVYVLFCRQVSLMSLLWRMARYLCTVWVQKIPPYGFLKFFPKRLGIFNQFLHTYYDHFYTRLQILFKYLQLWQSHAIL